VVLGKRRAHFRVADLLELERMLEGLCAQKSGKSIESGRKANFAASVTAIMPHMTDQELPCRKQGWRIYGCIWAIWGF
jgi:hypothetical protein